MRLDFGNWTQRLLSVEHLKLDIDNPRFSYFSKKKNESNRNNKISD